MDDLISRQAAIDAIERLILPQVKGETAAEEINRVAWRCAINCAEEMIVHLPSALPEIIRCKDCKYRDDDDFAQEEDFQMCLPQMMVSATRENGGQVKTIEIKRRTPEEQSAWMEGFNYGLKLRDGKVSTN